SHNSRSCCTLRIAGRCCPSCRRWIENARGTRARDLAPDRGPRPEGACMSTTISVLGGVRLFLLGTSVLTGGLRAVAGSGLRAILSKAAATPLSGAFWGAFVTLIVQSSSATTMTTIGLVSAGLLTFSQGLGLVFGANVGTTGTGWLIALIGVRVS